VSDADAGATRLRSPQESAVNRLKKPIVKQQSASRKCFSPKTATITAKMPRRARSSSKSPIRFIALDVRTSPPLEASTITAIAIQSPSHFMLLLLHGCRGFPRMLRQCRTSRYPAYSTTDQQYSQPAEH